MSLSTYLKDAEKCALTAVQTFGCVLYAELCCFFPPWTRPADNPNRAVVALKRTTFAEVNTFTFKRKSRSLRPLTVLGRRVEINVAAVRGFRFKAATERQRRLAFAPLSGSES